jgi:hypothetical protein
MSRYEGSHHGYRVAVEDITNLADATIATVEVIGDNPQAPSRFVVVGTVSGCEDHLVLPDGTHVAADLRSPLHLAILQAIAEAV